MTSKKWLIVSPNATVDHGQPNFNHISSVNSHVVDNFAMLSAFSGQGFFLQVITKSSINSVTGCIKYKSSAQLATTTSS